MPQERNGRLVYSTEIGRVIPGKAPPLRAKGDGIIRIQRQTKGRKGEGMCVITGLDLDDKQLHTLASELKKKCGCGGTVKEGMIEIQGDKRTLLHQLLVAKGFQVKFVGG